MDFYLRSSDRFCPFGFGCGRCLLIVRKCVTGGFVKLALKKYILVKTTSILQLQGEVVLYNSQTRYQYKCVYCYAISVEKYKLLKKLCITYILQFLFLNIIFQKNIVRGV